MTFDQFLAWHLDLVDKYKQGKSTPEDEAEFVMAIQTAIDGYHDISRYAGNKANQLLTLRDSVSVKK